MKPNKNFTLTVKDVDLIEHALSYQIDRLVERRITHVESTIIPEGDLPTVKSIDAEISEIRHLLGRLHNQKNFYRPSKKVYISG